MPRALLTVPPPARAGAAGWTRTGRRPLPGRGSRCHPRGLQLLGVAPVEHGHMPPRARPSPLDLLAVRFAAGESHDRLSVECHPYGYRGVAPHGGCAAWECAPGTMRMQGNSPVSRMLAGNSAAGSRLVSSAYGCCNGASKSAKGGE